jgi:hypothetical protein
MKKHSAGMASKPHNIPSQEIGIQRGNLSANRWLMAAAVILVLLFMTSLFKNIAHPLFWADEGMTVVGGTRILEFGYPKVHDGKNIFYDLQHPDKTLGVDEATDAYIGGANWGMYYLAAIGAKIAGLSDDMYVRTGILRTLFALFGLAGLAVWAFILVRIFRVRAEKLAGLTAFCLLTLLSIPLVLHLREVRYYSLSLFAVSASAFIYTNYRLFGEMTFRKYVILLSLYLELNFIVFSPSYFALITAIGINECIRAARQLSHENKNKGKAKAELPKALNVYVSMSKSLLLQVLPVLVSIAITLPLMVFFETFSLSKELSQFYADVLHTGVIGVYANNLSLAWRFFSSQDFLYLAFCLKGFLLILYLFEHCSKKVASKELPATPFSRFLSVLFIVYIFVAAKVPNPLFTRYLIPVQPALSLIIILDLYRIVTKAAQYRPTIAVLGKRLVFAMCTGFLILNITANFENIKGHTYELFHPYAGPLDYAIPFIKEKYGQTQNLVIATNYEETSFMYYLDAKVIVGYVGFNLEEDAELSPDVVFFRRYWKENVDVFQTFLNRGQFTKFDFPVGDFPFNNIPELNWEMPVKHQFRTLKPEDGLPETDIFVRAK